MGHAHPHRGILDRQTGSRQGRSHGLCTAVIFEIDKDDYAAALTAAHCVQHGPTEKLDLTVSGRNAVVIDSNALLDLAIVRYHARKQEKAIPLADALPYKGAEVMVVGYPFGVEDIAEQFGHVAQHNKETKTTWLNVDLIFGNSGGAAVDAQGRLVGINSAIISQGPAHLGAVVTIEHVQDYIDSYHAMMKRQKP
jgi:S1-C subfamily serine protease